MTPERRETFSEALLIKIIGVLKRKISDKTERTLAYRELIPFLIADGYNLEMGQGVCKLFDAEANNYNSGNNKNRRANNKGSSK